MIDKSKYTAYEWQNIQNAINGNTLKSVDYLEHLQSLTEDKLLEHVQSFNFISLFKPELHLWHSPFSNKSPEVFYNFMSTQSVVCIDNILAYTRKPIFNDKDLSLMSLTITDKQFEEIYQQVTIKLEGMLQFHSLNKSLEVKQHKNIGGKL